MTAFGANCTVKNETGNGGGGTGGTGGSAQTPCEELCACCALPDVQCTGADPCGSTDQTACQDALDAYGDVCYGTGGAGGTGGYGGTGGSGTAGYGQGTCAYCGDWVDYGLANSNFQFPGWNGSHWDSWCDSEAAVTFGVFIDCVCEVGHCETSCAKMCSGQTETNNACWTCFSNHINVACKAGWDACAADDAT